MSIAPYRLCLHALLLTALLGLSGCAGLTARLSDQPVDQDHGRRTLGAWIEDASIERKVRINLYRADARFRSAVGVVSFNGNLLLVGEVPSQALRDQAGRIAAAIRHVVRVHNELAVTPPTSALSGINDGWLTTKTKLRLLVDGNAPGRRTKVVTARGVVYLMGLLTRSEADAAVAQAQRVHGTQKIVKIIEYID